MDSFSFFPDDALNIYLVKEGLKPASFVYPEIDDSNYDRTVLDIDGVKLYQALIKDSVISDINHFFDQLGISYEKDQRLIFSLNEYISTGDENSFAQSREYSLGSTQNNLNSLTSAKDHITLGLALGFPKEAVHSFNDVYKGNLIDASYNWNEGNKARKMGIEVPTWLAYISHVVEELDIVNGNISESSRILGLKYQNHVRKNHPDLAQEVEKYYNIASNNRNSFCEANLLSPSFILNN